VDGMIKKKRISRQVYGGTRGSFFFVFLYIFFFLHIHDDIDILLIAFFTFCFLSNPVPFFSLETGVFWVGVACDFPEHFIILFHRCIIL